VTLETDIEVKDYHQWVVKCNCVWIKKQTGKIQKWSMAKS